MAPSMPVWSLSSLLREMKPRPTSSSERFNVLPASAASAFDFAHPGPCFIDRLLRLNHLRLRGSQLGTQIIGIKPSDHRASLNPIALARPEFGQTPGDLGGDIDLGRLEAAIARGKPIRQARRPLLVQVITAPGSQSQEKTREEKPVQTTAIHFVTRFVTDQSVIN